MNLKEKYELVCQVPSGQGLRAVAIVVGINSDNCINGFINTKLWDTMDLLINLEVIKMKKLFLNLEVIDGYPPVSMESV